MIDSIKGLAALAAAIALAGLVYAGCDHIYNMGERYGAATVQGKWDAEKRRQTQAVDQRRDAQQAVTRGVEVQYVDRWNTITVQGQTIVKEVPKYVPIDACTLPGGWRVLHDAAATGTDPDAVSVATSGVAPAPVSAQDAATAVAENYAGCRRNEAALDTWNAWADKQEALAAMATP